MIYTSRYSNPTLTQNPDKFAILQISVGAPRWRLPYQIAGAIDELRPFSLRNIQDKEEYRKKYVALLNDIGVEAISRMLQAWQQNQPDKAIVLCCFEDVRKLGKNWCHRSMFAKWWFQQTGERIEELPDPSKYKLDTDHPFNDTLEDFF